MQIQNQTQEKQTGILKDPGNMLIIFYLATVLFFLLFGGLVAANFPASDVHETVSVVSDNHYSDFTLFVSSLQTSISR